MSKADSNDPSRHFSTDHLRSDLRGRSVRAGAVTISTQIARFALNTGTTIVLARILTPEDFGLMGMLFAIVVFIEMFRDMGLSSATIQRAEVTHEQVNALFWINVFFSALVSLAIVVAAPYIAVFYDEPRITHLAYALAVTFFVGGVNSQHTALLTRQMRFTAQAVVTVSAMVASTGVAIVLAFRGWGYWALAIQQILLAVWMTVGMAIASGWMPGLPRWAPGVGPMLKYGFNLAAAGCVNTVARSMDSVLIGWRFGAAPVGLYTKAYQLVLMPIHQINGPLSRVAMPALSRLQNEPERYRRFYVNAVGMTAFLGMPVIAGLFVAAEPAIRLMLGPQWMESVPLFRLLGPAAFFGTFNIATAWVYLSLGRTDRQLRWGLISSSTTVIAFMIGLEYGPAGVATAFSITYCGVTMGVPGFWYCFRGTPLRLRDAWEAIWRPAVASVAAAVATFAFVRYAAMPHQAIYSLLIHAAVYTVLYALAWLALPDGRARLVGVLSLVKTLKQKPEAPRGFEVATSGGSSVTADAPPAATVGASA